MRGMVFTHKPHRLAYLLIPKVASISIRKSLKDWRESKDNTFPAEYRSFAFVRHPFDRVVSALYGELDGERAKAPMDVWRANQNNIHVKPQIEFLRGYRIDFLGRFDRLQADWERMQVQFNVQLGPLPKLHVNKWRPGDWRNAPLDWAELYGFYKEDFEICPDWARE